MFRPHSSLKISAEGAPEITIPAVTQDLNLSPASSIIWQVTLSRWNSITSERRAHNQINIAEIAEIVKRKKGTTLVELSFGKWAGDYLFLVYE